MDKKTVLRILDIQTKCMPTKVLKSATLNDVWYAFLTAWNSVHTEFPDIINAYQGSAFISQEFKDLVKNLGTKLKRSGIERHNLIGTSEK